MHSAKQVISKPMSAQMKLGLDLSQLRGRDDTSTTSPSSIRKGEGVVMTSQSARKPSDLKFYDSSSSSASRNVVSRACTTEDLETLDEYYQELKREKDIDVVLQQSCRDDRSKKEIVAIEKMQFDKSVRIKSFLGFAEHRGLLTKVAHHVNAGINTLDVAKMKFGDNLIGSIARGFYELHSYSTNTIVNVNVRDNRLTDEGIISLLLAITGKGIQKIDLSENSLWKRGAVALGNFIGNSEDILCIRLERCNISDTLICMTLETWGKMSNEKKEPNEGAEVKSAEQNGNQKESKVEIDEANFVHSASSSPTTKIPSALSSSKFSSLLTLLLSSNKIGDRGATAIANILKKSNLTVRSFSFVLFYL